MKNESSSEGKTQDELNKGYFNFYNDMATDFIIDHTVFMFML